MIVRKGCAGRRAATISATEVLMMGLLGGRRACSGWVAAILLFCASAGYAKAEPADMPVVGSEAAVLIEQHTGNVLFVKNGDERLYPASITKIATAILALEHSSMDDIVTVSKTARGEDGTRVYLAEGEQVSMEKLLYGMMLNSGNDAATAIAEHIDGSKEKFAARMNEFMRDTIGAYGTHFVNPSGLPDPEQYTTAADMAKLAKYAMDNTSFRRIVSTKKMPWAGREWTSTLENHNRMLTDYPGATGIKNGYTIAAGNTLVGSAEREGMSLIGVVLKAGSKNIAYADMTAMLDYGFANFGVKRLFAAGERYEMPAGAGDETSEWVADKAIWGVYPKDSTSETAIGADGSVTLEGERGSYAAGRLSPVKKEVAISAFAAKTDASAASKSDAADRHRSPTVYVIVASFAAALAAGALTMRRYRRRRHGGLYPAARRYDSD